MTSITNFQKGINNVVLDIFNLEHFMTIGCLCSDGQQCDHFACRNGKAMSDYKERLAAAKTQLVLLASEVAEHMSDIVDRDIAALNARSV